MKSIRNKMFRTGFITAVIIHFVALFAWQQVLAQEEIVDPLREYTDPEEIVTFNKNTNYSEAIEVINTFAQEYENKFIVDNSEASGPIGVSLPPMHWKDALEYIMRFQNLTLTENEDYYEINVQSEPDSQAQAGDGASGGEQEEEILADTRTQEIRINATFFEGNKRALQEIGIDWSTLTSDVPENVSDYVSDEGGESVPSSEFDDQFVAVNSYNAASVSQNAFNAMVNLGEYGPGISVQALFSAFEADNLGKILATPSIKVVDGQEGNIQVGQDFSIKQRDIAGNVTDNFVSTGTILTVTPQIIRNEDTSFVYLDLQVERSTAQPDVVSTIVNKQEATTSAILLNGESTYVAGLYRTEETEVRRGVPILKDLPGWFFGLRYLFGYNSSDYLENELIIIVQAEVVKPVKQRISEKLDTKRDVLNSTRDNMRDDLDRVFDNEFAESDTGEEAKPDPVPIKTDTVFVEVPVTTEPDTVRIEEPIEEEQELTLSVQHPELMRVVPKAFSMEEYLEFEENGEEVEDAKDLTYFIIGGSFLVPDNADRFKAMLDDEGYETRILFNPETRFNYVAFEAYEDYETARERTLEIRQTFNDEAWIFKLKDEE